MVAIEPLITVAWSLSYEFFYYLLVPLVIALSAMRRWQPRQRIAFLVFASAAGFIVAGIYGSYVRLLMFVGGMEQRRRQKRQQRATAKERRRHAAVRTHRAADSATAGF